MDYPKNSAPPPSPADQGDRDIASNSPVTLRTGCAQSPCFLCYLRNKISESPEANGAALRKGSLELNIVGVRGENTVSDDFDDLMIIFYRALVPGQRKDFEAAVEDDYRKDLKAMTHDRMRLVTCTDDQWRGIWVVGVFDHVTTDPGMEARRDEVRKAQEQALGKKLDAKREEVAKQEGVVDAKRAECTAAITERDKRTPPDPKAVKYAAKLEAQLASENKKLAARQSELESLKKQVTAAEAKRDAGSVQIGDGAHRGWLAEGRGMIAPGVYAGKYKLFIHHAGGSGGKFHHGHVALTVGLIPGYRFYSVGAIKKQWNDWLKRKASDDAVRDRLAKSNKTADPPAHEFTGDGLSVAKYIPHGGSAAKYDPGEARLVLENPEGKKVFDAFLVVGDVKKPTGDEDVVVTRGQIGGTNLHRAHNFKLSSDGTKLVGKDDLDPDASVSNWSEGCQTYRWFSSFNEFIHIAAVSKRWQCAKLRPACLGDRGCARLTWKNGDDLGAGEKALVARFGETYILTALAAKCGDDADNERKRQDNLQRELEKLKAEFEKLSGTQKQLTEERGKASPWRYSDQTAYDALHKKKQHPKDFTAADKQSLDELETRYKARWTKQPKLNDTDRDIKIKNTQIEGKTRELESSKDTGLALSDASTDAAEQAEIATLSDQIGKLDTAIAKQDADEAAIQATLDEPAPKHPLPPSQRTKLDGKLKELKDDRAANDKARSEKKKRLDELNSRAGLKEDTRKKRRDFIRERTQVFAADFLRECDLGPPGQAACAIDFDYVLIELPPDEVAEIRQARFTENSRNQKWDGDPVLGTT